ncbi:hypothetical protein B0H14DRAFT_2609404 [Mycena olivaceomarginata]|nr:hypothetical protein B0H14DRAFT_2609404 [Mycena olivaceomarginata]
MISDIVSTEAKWERHGGFIRLGDAAQENASNQQTSIQGNWATIGPRDRGKLQDLTRRGWVTLGYTGKRTLGSRLEITANSSMKTQPKLRQESKRLHDDERDVCTVTNIPIHHLRHLAGKRPGIRAANIYAHLKNEDRQLCNWEH